MVREAISAAMLCLLALILTAPLTGCKEPEPEEPPPPPPPTADEIYNEIRPTIAPLLAHGFISDEQIQQSLSSFQQKVSQHRQSVNGPQALQRIESDVESMIAANRDAEAWRKVVAGIDAFKILNPNAARYDRLRERAILILGRPDVSVKGNMAIDGVPNIFVEVQDKQTGQTTTYRNVREGEEFHPGPEGRPVLRLNRIIGDHQAYEFEYLVPGGMAWEVPAPKR